MNHIFSKLNYKNQQEIHVINAPESFAPHLEEMKALCRINKDLEKGLVSFLLIFVTRTDEINDYAMRLHDFQIEDPVVWFAYPKKSSRKFRSDISRDSGWSPLGDLGFEPVRQIAIDEDWSALRFRKADFIKTMKREPARRISRIRSKKN
jgi:hypothetical protein